MTIAYWHDDYLTYDPVVDSQHQHLFELVNILHDAMLKGHGKEVIQPTLEELIKYTIEHFKMEENLMLYHNYPNYISHHQKHEQLTKTVTDLALKFQQGDSSINTEVLQFLNQWLIHHIKGEDQQMIKFFRNKQRIVSKTNSSSPQSYNKQVLANTEKTQELIKQAKEKIKNLRKNPNEL